MAQKSDFEAILEAMDNLPVTVRLLDPPLHEFLPSITELEVKEATTGLNDEEKALLAAARSWDEVNPMLGTRGVRLGVVKPGLYAMQVHALMQAAAQRVADGGKPRVEVMIPLTVTRQELGLARSWVGGRHRRGDQGGQEEARRHHRHHDRDAAGRGAGRRDRRGSRLLQLRYQRPDPDDLRLQPRRRRGPDDEPVPGGGPAGPQPLRDHRPGRASASSCPTPWPEAARPNRI